MADPNSVLMYQALPQPKSKLLNMSSSAQKLQPLQSHQLSALRDKNFSMLSPAKRQIVTCKTAQKPSAVSKEAKESEATDLLVIHVFDENRQTTKDFKCSRKLLLDNMKYFEAYLTDDDANQDDIDI